MDVVLSPDILINRGGGRSGLLERPSRQQLKDAFGTDDFNEAFERMSCEGNLLPSHRHFEITPTSKPTFVGRHHTFTR